MFFYTYTLNEWLGWIQRENAYWIRYFPCQLLVAGDALRRLEAIIRL